MVSSCIGIHASENSLSTNRPISAAANEVVILTRVTNARLVLLGRLVAGHLSLV